MLITGREAAHRLGAAGLTRRQANRVLTAGFAGAPVRSTGAHLYDARRVADLERWPTVGDDVLDRACPRGIFIARRDVDLDTPAATQRETVRADWPISPYTAVLLRSRIEASGSLPFVATVCGFVALGADLTGLVATAHGSYLLELDEPGAWFEPLRGRRIPTGPGRPWVIRRGRPYAGGGTSMGQSKP